MNIKRRVKKFRRMIRFAEDLALLSLCKKKQVGSVIFPSDCSKVYAIGHSGPPAGIDNDRCDTKKDPCGCMHAEVNALVKMNPDRVGEKSAILYSSAPPCVKCAGAIINSGAIGLVFYGDAPMGGTGTAGLDEFDNTNIHYMPAVHVTADDWWTGAEDEVLKRHYWSLLDFGRVITELDKRNV